MCWAVGLAARGGVAGLWPVQPNGTGACIYVYYIYGGPGCGPGWGSGRGWAAARLWLAMAWPLYTVLWSRLWPGVWAGGGLLGTPPSGL